jgi:glycosyltransferase involved in cell wall biosynthesis
MKVSYLLTGFGHTGGSMVLYNFMDKLCERGYEVFAVTPGEVIGWKPGFSRQLIKQKFQNVGLYKRIFEIAVPLAKRIKLLDRLGRMILRLPPAEVGDYLKWLTKNLLINCPKSDVIIATYHMTAFAAYLLMDNSVPFYHMQHYEEVFGNDDLSRKIARLTYYMPLVLIANSRWLQNQIKKRIGRDSMLLNPGINTVIFYPRRPLSEKYRLMEPLRIVSYYSPLKFKAWDEAVTAMDMVLRKLSLRKVEWVVFGGAPLVKPTVPCKFVGRVFGESLAELYSSAHIVFMNSWYESFPLPPLEAMACGTAVVTTRLGTEDYAFDGENSIVVPPRDPMSLAEAILRLADDPILAQRLAEEGIATAKQFTWDRATDQLEQILSEGIKKPPSEPFKDINGLVRGMLHETR